jgi:hypothetical protein
VKRKPEAVTPLSAACMASITCERLALRCSAEALGTNSSMRGRRSARASSSRARASASALSRVETRASTTSPSESSSRRLSPPSRLAALLLGSRGTYNRRTIAASAMPRLAALSLVSQPSISRKRRRGARDISRSSSSGGATERSLSATPAPESHVSSWAMVRSAARSSSGR